MSTEQFLELTQKDGLLEDISREHNYLLSDLYKLDKAYIRLALIDWWEFVEHYQRLLKSIGVHIAVPRLSRKIQKNLKWWKRLYYFLRRTRFPPIRILAQLKDVEKWRNDFIRLNSNDENGWPIKRDRLVRRLNSLLESSLQHRSSDSEVERLRSRIRIKFAVHRLGQLGFADSTSKVIALLKESPWAINPRRLCRDLAMQGEVEALLNVFNELTDKKGEEWAYIRSVILKGFASIPGDSEEVIKLLRNAALNATTSLEKTMASESLILLKDKGSDWVTDRTTQDLNYKSDSYLAKNYVLLFPLDDSLSGVRLSHDVTNGRVLNNALQYKRIDPELSSIYRYEPDVLRLEFYESEYPDGPEEFEYCSY